MKIFNKKTNKVLTSFKIVPYVNESKILSTQVRFKHIGFLDQLGGRDDERFPLQLNPGAWRDKKGKRQLDYYTGYFPIQFLMVVCGFPILLSIFTLIHYSLTASDVT